MGSYHNDDHKLPSSPYKQQLYIHHIEDENTDEEDSSAEDSDEEDTNAGWGEEVDRIESAVLDHVADPGIATYLIEKLYYEFVQQKAQAINGWQATANQCQGMEESSKGKSPEDTANRSSGNPLKRRRPSDEYNSDEDANEEGDGDGHRPPKPRGSGPNQVSRMFACPLFKLDPDLHCRDMDGKLFLPCQRGFKTLQRLK